MTKEDKRKTRLLQIGVSEWAIGQAITFVLMVKKEAGGEVCTEEGRESLALLGTITTVARAFEEFVLRDENPK